MTTNQTQWTNLWGQCGGGGTFTTCYSQSNFMYGTWVKLWRHSVGICKLTNKSFDEYLIELKKEKLETNYKD